MLAAVPGREVEARTYHSLAIQWLDELFSLPEDDREYGDVTDEDLAAITVAAALVHGPEEVCTFLGRLQPLTARHSAATQTLDRLMDIGRDELVRAIGMTANHPYTGIAACREIRREWCRDRVRQGAWRSV